MPNQSQQASSSYDYSMRTGVREISWNDFHGLVRALVTVIAPWKPEIILPIGRGGYYPGTLMAHMLQAELYPVRLSRRERDVVVRGTPLWLIPPQPAVTGRRVLIVDEISSTGETLSMVRDRLLEMAVSDIRSAVLYAHTTGVVIPDYIALITDELVINPWDRELYLDGEFILHPEYVEALIEQGRKPKHDLLIPAPISVADKPH